MNLPRPANPASPLRAFAAALGLAGTLWPAREDLKRLRYEDEVLDRDRVAALQRADLTPLTDAYGDALACRFYLGGEVVLDVKPGLSEADLETFRRRTAHTPTVGLDFTLDKERLVSTWFGLHAGHRLFLYLYPEALTRFMQGPLQNLEALLWGTEPDARVVIIVPAREICLAGRSLAVIGGARAASWQAQLPSGLPDAARLREVYDRRAEIVRWQDSWLKSLTPLHLFVAGDAAPDDAIAVALRVHLLNLIVLYTADRTVSRSGRWVSTYAGVPESVEVYLPDPRSAALANDSTGHLETLMRLFDWVYDPKWVIDRLLLTQLTVAHALHDVAPAGRYGRIVERAEPLFGNLRRQWKSLIAGKVEVYSEQVRALEDYVAATVQLVADQIAALTKTLSDTMLAAVAALLASFIGAIFQNNFNGAVFRLGMIVYAVYVLLFPLAYNMRYQWQRHTILERDFATRRARFEDRLSRDQVDEITGRRVAESITRFNHWFWLTVIIYCVAAALALAAAFTVPALVGKSFVPAKTHLASAAALQYAPRATARASLVASGNASSSQLS